MSYWLDKIKTINGLSLFFFYLLVTAFLLASNIDTISTVTYEMADFAANSLLIQDAKSFSLWVGNYSRVGFNHPGPAILYVLALGEIIANDWLHIVNYPFAGQIIAIAFYNAFWITLTLSIFYKVSKSVSVSLSSLCVLLLILALMDYSFFNGAWMPHLYLFPFVVAVAAIARLISGKTDSLQSLALSSGFLINGHVSFVGILGVMLIFSVVANYLLYKGRAQKNLTIISSIFITKERRALSLACLTLCVFFIPIIIKTITEFPGPVMEYASFSGGHKANSLRDSAAFIAFYWGGWAPLTLAFVFLGMTLWLAKWLPEQLRISLKSMAFALISATVALFVYARYGVDFLDQKYIGFFYYAVPALTVALTFLTAVYILKPSIKKFALPILSVLSLSTVFYLIKNPVEYSYLYSDNGIPGAFEQLKAKKTDHTLVLDLDDKTHWAQVWSSVLGLEAYAKRRGEKIFCVGKNWHISLTKEYRCSLEDVRSGKHLVVTDYNNYVDQVPEISAVGVSFYKYEIPDISNRGHLTVLDSAAEFGTYFLASGWSTVEKEMVWSTGKEAHLYFRVMPGISGHIKIDIEPFLPRATSTQTVTFSINDHTVSQLLLTRQNARQWVEVPVIGSNDVQDIKVTIDRPISPKSAGLSSDTRELGVALFGFMFEGVKQ